MGNDVKDFPHVPVVWYKNTTEQSHVDKVDWNYVEIRTKIGEMREMQMGVQLLKEEVKAYKGMIEEFSDVFAWSYEDLKGIPPELVEYRIPLIPGGRPSHQKKKNDEP